MRDLRYAFRSLARTPAFSVTAVLILSLAVGATTAVFTLLYALVLRPLPIQAIGMACALLFVVSSVASLLPAVRAGRVEPLAELRRD